MRGCTERGEIELTQIDTSVDVSGNEILWLLNKTLNLASIVVDDNTELAGIFNRSGEKHTRSASGSLEINHFLERIITSDIGVENKERFTVIEMFLSEFDRTSSAHGFMLEGGGDFDTELLTLGIQEFTHLLGLVIDRENDFGATDLGQRLDLMHNHGLVAELHQGLRFRQGQRAETGAEATYENQSLHCGVGGLVMR